MLNSTTDDVLITVGVALVYLLGLRLIDVNEREPLWSVLLAFVLGGAGAGALNLGVSPMVLNLGTWQGAALREAALGAVLVVAFRIFSEIGRLRGWSEVTDLVDGMLYGAAAGLGFTCGEAIANLEPTLPLVFGRASVVTTVSTTALAGLAQGVFGAITGAGFGLAATRRTRRAWLWPLVALAAAIAAHGAHEVLAFGNALGGPAAVLRGRVALVLPVLAVAALAAYGLATERRVIARELASESGDGYVTAAELALLGNFGRRQLRYLRALATARFRELRALSALHNRQVMLALAKRRVHRAAGEPARLAASAEVDALRRSILVTRAHLDAGASGAAGASQ